MSLVGIATEMFVAGGLLGAFLAMIIIKVASADRLQAICRALETPMIAAALFMGVVFSYGIGDYLLS